MAKIVCSFISYTLKRTVDITVVIPSPTIPQSMRRFKAAEPCYHTPAEKYPVLYLLHGMGNNHSTWTGYTNVEMYAEERQIAIVNISAENKAYITRGSDDFFAFVSEELPDFVCGMFPISRKPEDTYIAGLSMGGYGTLVHGFNFPERFAAIGAFSAATRLPVKDATYDPDKMQKAYRDGTSPKTNPQIDPKFDPTMLAQKIVEEGKKFPPTYMACGCEDFLFASNQEFRDLLISLDANVTWDEIPGYGHEWRFWDTEVERFLDWIPRSDYYAKLGKRRI